MMIHLRTADGTTVNNGYVDDGTLDGLIVNMDANSSQGLASKMSLQLAASSATFDVHTGAGQISGLPAGNRSHALILSSGAIKCDSGSLSIAFPTIQYF